MQKDHFLGASKEITINGGFHVYLLVKYYPIELFYLNITLLKSPPYNFELVTLVVPFC